MKQLLKSKELFTNPDSGVAFDFIRSFEYPWDAVGQIEGWVSELGASLEGSGLTRVGEGVWVGADVDISRIATLEGPAVIMPGAKLRPGAFIRGAVFVGTGCVVGNSTELKNCVLLDGVQVPHFNYVGDSVLGYKAHFGAGVIASNLRTDKAQVSIRIGEDKINTGMRKLGAIVGDMCEVGCNSVLNPGTVLGRGVTVYPLSSVRSFLPSGTVFKGEM